MSRKVLLAIVFLLGSAATCIADDKADDNKPKAQPPAQVTGVGAPAVEPKAQGLDMVSDTVAGVFSKANALLSGNLEVTMSKKVDKRDDYTINAMGQRVPKASAINTGGALHNDEPL